MSGKTHQNGQELAIKREAVKGNRNKEDSKAGVKARDKQDIEGDWGFFFSAAFILFWIHGVTVFHPKLVGAHLQTGNKFCSSGVTNSP